MAPRGRSGNKVYKYTSILSSCAWQTFLLLYVLFRKCGLDMTWDVLGHAADFLETKMDSQWSEIFIVAINFQVIKQTVA